MIDYDEAALCHITRRKPANARQERLYPASLLPYPVQFGKHQLMLCFAELLTHYGFETEPDAGDIVAVLGTIRTDTNERSPQEVDAQYGELVVTMKQIGSPGK